MMWWAMWCAAVVAASARAAPASDPMPALDLLQIEPAPDDVGLDAASFAPGQLRGHYGAGGDAPWLYLFADMPHDSQSLSPMERQVRSRPKRKMPSLSINNPMEVLRQRLLLEVARKQMREASQRQAVANRLFLQNVGKRGFWPHEDTSRYGN